MWLGGDIYHDYAKFYMLIMNIVALSNFTLEVSLELRAFAILTIPKCRFYFGRQYFIHVLNQIQFS